MTTRRNDDGGWVMVAAMAMMVVTLLLGFAMLAIVDTQTSAAGREPKVDSSFNSAEGVLRASIVTLGGYWVALPSQVRNASPSADTSCGSAAQTYTSGSPAATPFDTNLRTVLSQSFGRRAGTWKVNLCQASATDTGWDPTFLTSRPARSGGDLWVRAQTTVNGVRSAAVVRVYAPKAATSLPSGFAMQTGSFGTSDITTATGSVLSGSSTIGTSLSALLNQSGGGLITPASAKIGVRCGLLSAVDGVSCLNGTLAGAGATLDQLKLGNGLNGILGTDRTVQVNTWRAASQAQINAYMEEADAAANGSQHIATVANNGACFTGTTSASVVYIDSVGSDGNGTCTISGGQTAKIVVVDRGNVVVSAKNTFQQPPIPAFTGVIYALYNQRSETTFGKAHDTVVTITGGATVKGAIFVDYGGGLQINMPPVTVTSALCNLLPVLGQATCALLSPANLLSTVIGAVGLGPVVTSLLGNYTAVAQDPTVVTNAGTSTRTTAKPTPGSFRQLSPN